jgi:GT2 family glycosyltransferase
MSNPWLSVIMPLYNGAAYLAQALASIECQADGDIEVIAVDGGSSDATLAILNAYSSRLSIRTIRPGGTSSWVTKTNLGLSEARGEYASFLHHDDVWLPGRLRLLRQLLVQEPQAALLIHPSRYIDIRGRWLGVWRSPLNAGRWESETVIEQLLVQNFIAVPAPLFAREAALRVGGLNESLWYTADWDFWLKMAALGPTVYHPKPLAAFRIHSLSQTAQGVARAEEMRRQIESVLNKHLSRWEAAHPERKEVGQAARLSMELNHALAACAYGDRPRLLTLARGFLALGPEGWHRFFRDSRILERVAAQVRARTGCAKGDPPWRSRTAI